MMDKSKYYLDKTIFLAQIRNLGLIKITRKPISRIFKYKIES